MYENIGNMMLTVSMIYLLLLKRIKKIIIRFQKLTENILEKIKKEVFIEE